MWLVLFLLIFIFGIIFSKISINIKNIIIDKSDVDFDISVSLYLYGFLKILSLKCNKLGFQIFGKTIPYKKIIKNLEFEKLMKKDFKDFDLKKLKKMDLKIDRAKFTLKIGAEDVFITSFLVVFISTYISNFLRKEFRKLNYKKINYNIFPEFNNVAFHLEGNTILSVKSRNLGIFLKSSEHNK